MSKEDKKAVIQLNDKTNLISHGCECPICGDKFMHGAPYFYVKCFNCGNTHKTDFNLDIYSKKARHINQKISHNNEVKFQVQEKYESAAAHIRHHFISQKCYNVSKLKPTTKSYRYCKNCGKCYNCMVCRDCSHIFKKNPSGRKQKCPVCDSSNLRQYYFQGPEKINEKIHACPECNSRNVSMTKVEGDSCQLCGSEDLGKEHTDIIFTFTIKRKGGYKY